jgi:hypothetical protein
VLSNESISINRGGFDTRLGEKTDTRPKAMVEVFTPKNYYHVYNVSIETILNPMIMFGCLIYIQLNRL